ncbi:hypothetical protein [Scytonema sp. HK-05]|uniref:hypothetical protein n=1 Tax=Scytonema sp. HK-05 TaxID=1137095 RepID=UPI0013017478|nr:hypothetical protein [Scytonema sp. HK-05]
MPSSLFEWRSLKGGQCAPKGQSLPEAVKWQVASVVTPTPGFFCSSTDDGW